MAPGPNPWLYWAWFIGLVALVVFPAGLIFTALAVDTKLTRLKRAFLVAVVWIILLLFVGGLVFTVYKRAEWDCRYDTRASSCRSDTERLDGELDIEGG